MGSLEICKFLFLFFQTKWWNKNLEIIYEENPIFENPKPRKIKTIYNLILKKINVGNKLKNHSYNIGESMNSTNRFVT